MSFCILMKYSSETPNSFSSRRDVEYPDIWPETVRGLWYILRDGQKGCVDHFTMITKRCPEDVISYVLMVTV